MTHSALGLIIAAIIGLFACAWGQDVTVSLESYRTGQPLESAHFWASGVLDTLMTSDSGLYEFDLPDGTQDLWIGSVGYCDSMQTVMISDSTPVVMSVELLDGAFLCEIAFISQLTWPEHDMTYEFWIANYGGLCDLFFSITDTSEWLSTSPEFGTIAPDCAQTITVFMDADYLHFPGDERQSILRIDHSAANSPYIIPVVFYTESQPGEAPNLPDILPLYAAVSAFPNPFNSSTRLSYGVPRNGQVNLAIYDLTGRLVRTLEDRVIPQGKYSLTFDGSALPSGMYFVRLNAQSFSAAQKLLLLK